jgi:hypothetical protein
MIRILVALVLLVSPAEAQDRLSLILGSRHLGGFGFDGRNPGLFLTWDRAGMEWSIGAYRNSYGRGSLAATVGLPVVRWNRGAASLFFGLAWYPKDGHRFRAHAGDIVPIGGLQVRRGAWFIQVMPSDGRPVRAILTTGLTFPLDQ